MINENLLTSTLRAAPPGDLHVFAYGSLMWRPDFPHAAAVRGRVWGYRRRLAVWSFHYRGTLERPGLAFGLDAGGSCGGTLYLVRAAHRRRVMRRLFEREMLTDIYTPLFLPVAAAGKTRTALVFVVNRRSAQYAPPLPDAQVVKIIRTAAGVGGANVDYVRNTYRRMTELGIASPALARLCRLLDAGVK